MKPFFSALIDRPYVALKFAQQTWRNSSPHVLQSGIRCGLTANKALPEKEDELEPPQHQDAVEKSKLELAGNKLTSA